MLKTPRVIAVWGKADFGKTHTLNLLINKLLSTSCASLLLGTLSSSMSEDTAVVLQYGRLKIGVITNGDNEQCLLDSYHRIGIDCDLYVLACRTKGSSCKWIKETFGISPILWYGKAAISCECGYDFEQAAMQVMQNETDALNIMSIINMVTK